MLTAMLVLSVAIYIITHLVLSVAIYIHHYPNWCWVLPSTSLPLWCWVLPSTPLPLLVLFYNVLLNSSMWIKQHFKSRSMQINLWVTISLHLLQCSACNTYLSGPRPYSSLGFCKVSLGPELWLHRPAIFFGLSISIGLTISIGRTIL